MMMNYDICISNFYRIWRPQKSVFWENRMRTIKFHIYQFFIFLKLNLDQKQFLAEFV